MLQRIGKLIDILAENADFVFAVSAVTGFKIQMAHSFRNVRQLQNALFRAAVLCEGDALTPQDFPQIASRVVARAEPAAPSARTVRSEAGITLFENDGHIRALEEIEADVIRLAIGHYRGRMTEVARRLGIGRSTLYRKLTELGIDNAA